MVSTLVFYSGNNRDKSVLNNQKKSRKNLCLQHETNSPGNGYFLLPSFSGIYWNSLVRGEALVNRFRTERILLFDFVSQPDTQSG